MNRLDWRIALMADHIIRLEEENRDVKTELAEIKEEFKIDVLHCSDGTKDYRCRCWVETNERMGTIKELVKDKLCQTNIDDEFLNKIYSLTLP